MNNRSTKAVADFFSTMLDDKGVMEELQQQPLERLLAQVTVLEPQQELSVQVIDPALLIDNSDTITKPSTDIISESAAPSVPEIALAIPEVLTTQQSASEVMHAGQVLKNELSDSFPVLYFDVGEYTFAVPLINLRAIYQLKEPTKIFGKPDWFSGIQVEREQNLGIVDTACYLMPEKFDSSLEHSLNYKYIIVLGDSNWGLKCDSLVDSENLSHDEIKWRTKGKSSPWLAGTVKQRMCGLLAVDALIELLEKNTSV